MKIATSPFIYKEFLVFVPEKMWNLQGNYVSVANTNVANL